MSAHADGLQVGAISLHICIDDMNMLLFVPEQALQGNHKSSVLDADGSYELTTVSRCIISFVPKDPASKALLRVKIVLIHSTPGL